MKWAVGVLGLIVFYFAGGPWVVMLILAVGEDWLSGDRGIGMAIELSMRPALWVGERVELYAEYFWWVLSLADG